MGDNKKGLKQKEERLGEVNISNEGYEMKIVEYNNSLNIIIEFQNEHKTKVRTNYDAFKRGNVKNPYHKSVFGVGCIGEGKYKSKENGKTTKAYRTWMDMLRRCYDPYYLNKEPTYIDCYVCDEWLCFQNFAKWFYKNHYECNNECMHLVKDILIKGNKIYSPETCIFVPQKINYLFVKKQKDRGEYPIGVSPHKTSGKLLVQCSTLGKQERLGLFPINKPFQAFTVYKNFKEKYIKEVADEYKDMIPKKLYEAMYKYEIEIND